MYRPHTQAELAAFESIALGSLERMRTCSCALRVATRGPRTGTQIGKALGLEKRGANGRVVEAVTSAKAAGATVEGLLIMAVEGFQCSHT